jgi:c-di-GMP-binding flagellar brake protein YcgR
MSNAEALEPAADGAERRHSIRRPLRGFAEVTFAGQSANKARMLDISAAGMGIVAAFNPAPRTPCLIRFTLHTKPSQTQFNLKAVVVYSVFSSREGNFRVGLLFANLSAEDADSIQGFVASTQVTQVDRVG